MKAANRFFQLYLVLLCRFWYSVYCFGRPVYCASDNRPSGYRPTRLLGIFRGSYQKSSRTDIEEKWSSVPGQMAKLSWIGKHLGTLWSSETRWQTSQLPQSRENGTTDSKIIDSVKFRITSQEGIWYPWGFLFLFNSKYFRLESVKCNHKIILLNGLRAIF